MQKILKLTALTVLPLLVSNLQAQNKEAKKESSAKEISITKQDTVTIAGTEIAYSVEASTIALKNSKNQDRASVFHFTYLKKDVADKSKRPVMFAFNGGPGSSAVWLHLGALGPKIVPTSKNGTSLIKPNLSLQQNPHSILDVADLVFVDPVSTGYSKIEQAGKPHEFHGVESDIDSMGDFIRKWVTKHKRWESPKFLLGESYGGIRVAGLANHLQSRYGMNLNGVVLLSSLLDFSTLNPSQGNDLSYLCFLPSMTAVAHYHEVIKGDRKTLLANCEKFTDRYAAALRKGNILSEKEKNEVAQELKNFTGLEVELIKKLNLRISPARFRKELLKSKGKVLGRFDGRVAWDSFSSGSTYPTYDPSYSVAKGAFSTCMLSYLTTDIGWKSEHPYEILTPKVHPWNWNAKNGYVNLAPKISSAIKNNPQLKVLVQCGYTDLATPAAGILHSVNHMNIPKNLRNNISVTWYDAGHMFYLNETDLIKNRKDLVKFITQ